MSRGLKVLSKLKSKAVSSLNLKNKSQNITVKAILKNVPSHLAQPPYAMNGIVPPSPLQAEVKTSSEIKCMKEACAVARKVLNTARDFVKVGVSTEEIDQIVHDAAIERGVYPSPLNYKGFPKSVCTSVNDVVCHGIPDTDTILKDGDIINVDVSVYLKGFHGDLSETFLVGNVDDGGKRLVSVTKDCLYAAINVCKHNERFSLIGKTISDIAKRNGFHVVPNFIGHGIGRYFHGPPDIFHFENENLDRMKSGMTFTIEPIITEGFPDFVILDDGWTCVSCDGSRSAQFEHTILITDNGAEILTVDNTTEEST
ncbi:methionine aminopeptidase 1D, mitochondrial-like isoform X2 [Dendronephthya gigantea]|uniref:methionine aminopeptidase 1D, mitochondrial-like isoform X2 n=1 Tax=Dendronephthya gigantea TaxID=151771 RepID=UPI00106ACB6D|nr:methionine aminopeptidase 1D, mitochondrial-like isoform X2 [Dendronephthya gigantea]